MNNDSTILILNLDKIHTTKMGMERIKRNLNLGVNDIADWCRVKIRKQNSFIYRKGKNWYVVDNCSITVNAYSYTIITAHKIK